MVDLIYRVYERLGREPDDVETLLANCDNDERVWDIYKKGCTLGINQVEQPGTSSRVGKYAPHNVSELCAFIAAIRPGFKSLYKQFEAREPFDYGIKSFDELIQTEEMPHSYLLYQEMTMTALHYAGIDMGETMTVIKAISKKKVKVLMSYKDRFLKGFAAAMQRDEGTSEAESDRIAHQVWQILEDSSRYQFNACLSGDTRFFEGGATLAEMYESKDIPEKAWSMDSAGRMIRNDVINIHAVGVKQTYRVTLANGAHIDCTEEHKFPTPAGKRMLKDITTGEMLYVMPPSINNYATLVRIISIEPKTIEPVFNVEMATPYHNFAVDSGIITSNSHSYCVALDSLYGAYLKSNYPLQFYEAFLTLQEEKGDKDKLNAAIDEAEDYFKIKFPPYRFGQDNRKITADPSTNSITKSIGSIKNVSKKLGDILYDCVEQNFTTFTDVILYLDSHGVKSTLEKLIQIDYFADFGNCAELLRIYEVFDTTLKRGTAKSVKKDKFSIDSPFLDLLAAHGTDKLKNGGVAKSYTITDMYGLLLDIEKFFKNAEIEDLPFLVKMRNQQEILGYIDLVTGKQSDRRKLIVTDVRPLSNGKDVWGYAAFARSIGSGKQSRWTIRANTYAQEPIKPMEIIYVHDFFKNQKGYFYLTKYERIV